MRIRKAEHIDIPKILPLIQAFHKETLKPFGMGWDPVSVENTILSFSENHTGLVVETKQADESYKIIGCIGGAIAPSFTDYKQSIFVESIWYVLPEYRGGRTGIKLLDLVEDYCRQKGISKIVMIGMFDDNIERLSGFYNKKGYKELELHFIKDLNDAN